jgi:hypothetical protein
LLDTRSLLATPEQPAEIADTLLARGRDSPLVLVGLDSLDARMLEDRFLPLLKALWAAGFSDRILLMCQQSSRDAFPIGEPEEGAPRGCGLGGPE